jgi:hypothetical protein
MNQRQAAAKKELSWVARGVWVALILGLGNLAFSYLNLALLKHWWPLPGSCSVVVNTVPNGVSRATAGADAHGNGEALVFWRPPVCPGSDHPITKYSINAWLFVNGRPQGVVITQYVTAGNKSVIISGLTNGDYYNFGISAWNAIGSSPPTFTNQVSPPDRTSA